MESGIVKFFDSRDNKRFGFLRLESGEEIFFHFNDGENLEEGDEEPQFCGGRPGHDPQKGDRLVFERNHGYKGPKAAPWGFAQDYERIQKAIDSRPRYRVWKQDGWWPNKQWFEPKIIWEGTSVKELLRKYSLQHGRSPICDALISFWSHDDGIQVRHWFERQEPDGTWKRCQDPRPLSPVLRQLERANWR